MSTLYAGLDVSLETTSVCVVDADRQLLAEKKVNSDPEAIAKALLLVEGAWEHIGLEAGPSSQWLYFGLNDAGLLVHRHAARQSGSYSR